MTLKPLFNRAADAGTRAAQKKGRKLLVMLDPKIAEGNKLEGFALHRAKALVRHGADLSLRDERGNTALMHAADDDWRTGGMLEIILQYRAQGLDINAVNVEGQSALWLAVRNGDAGSVGRLLEAGVTVDEAALRKADVGLKSSALRIEMFETLKKAQRRQQISLPAPGF